MSTFKRNIFKTVIEDDIVYFEKTFGASGGSTGGNACALSDTGLTLYTLTNTIVAGTIFYSETSVPTVFNGSGLFWHSSNGFSYQITSSGEVVGIFECTGGGEVFSYKRDGSQVPENPDFHTPTVDYLDLSGNPQTFFADPNSDACGSFYALEIVNVNYCFPC